MRSKGGVREYFCPECGSDKITLHMQYGQRSYSCRACHKWGPWKERQSARAKEQGDKLEPALGQG
jgi:predicted ATP-dependent serine protease